MKKAIIKVPEKIIKEAICRFLNPQEYDVFIFPDQRTGITVANYKWALTNELPAEGDIIIISSDQDGYFYIISALVLMEEC